MVKINIKTDKTYLGIGLIIHDNEIENYYDIDVPELGQRYEMISKDNGYIYYSINARLNITIKGYYCNFDSKDHLNWSCNVEKYNINDGFYVTPLFLDIHGNKQLPFETFFVDSYSKPEDRIDNRDYIFPVEGDYDDDNDKKINISKYELNNIYGMDIVFED